MTLNSGTMVDVILSVVDHGLMKGVILTPCSKTVMISYLIRNRYDLIITDCFSFQHSFVHFLHHFLLLLHIAAFHAIYR